MAEQWAMPIYTSRRWRGLRQALIAERGARCAKCGKIMADTSRLQADHIVELTPSNIHDADIAYNSNNLQLLCEVCHNEKHQRMSGGNTHKVYLVYGPPCGGRNEWAAARLRRGDILLDMDLLYLAVSGCELYDKPDNIRQVVFRLRDTMLDCIKTRLGRWNDAYILGGYPYKAQREALAKDLGAELVLVDNGRPAAEAAAEAMGPFAKEWRGYVDRWYDDAEL